MLFNQNSSNKKLRAFLFCSIALFIVFFILIAEKTNLSTEISNRYQHVKFTSKAFFEDSKSKARDAFNINIKLDKLQDLEEEKQALKNDAYLTAEQYKCRIQSNDKFSKAKISTLSNAKNYSLNDYALFFKGGKGFSKQQLSLEQIRPNHTLENLAGALYRVVNKALTINLNPVDLYMNKRFKGIYITRSLIDKYVVEANAHRESAIFSINQQQQIHFKTFKEGQKQNFLNLNKYSFVDFIDPQATLNYLAISFILNQTQHLSPEHLFWFYNSVTHRCTPLFFILEHNPSNQIENLDAFISIVKEQNPYLKAFLTDTLIKKLPYNLQTIKHSVDQKTYQDSVYVNFKQKSLGLALNSDDLETEINQRINMMHFETTTQKAIKKSIVRISKDTLIDQDLTIQPHEHLMIGPGIQIDFSNNANLFVYGQISCLGIAQKPTTFKSIEGSLSSIYIESSSEIENTFTYTSFTDLSALSKEFWMLPSAVTLYDSRAQFKHCTFNQNKVGDDMINLFRCPKISFSNCVFQNILSDAIDSDFSTIDVAGCTFENIGNDAVDGSGSEIQILKSRFRNIEDKAISAGEASVFKSKENCIDSAELALVCKDGSVIFTESDSLGFNGVDLVAFIKKPEYQTPSIYVSNTHIKSTLIEYNIQVDGLKNVQRHKNVKSMLYGNQYGKASK